MSILNWFKKKSLTHDAVFDSINIKVFKKKDILKVIKTCPNGSRILINPTTWIQVYHNEVTNEPTNQPG